MWLAINALATFCIAYTITRQVIFRPIRLFVKAHGPVWLYELFTCPYCMAFWAGAFVMLWGKQWGLTEFFAQVALAHMLIAAFAKVTGFRGLAE
jgi:hypothetical protein